MTAFIYSPNVEGPCHESRSMLVPGKRGICKTLSLWESCFDRRNGQIITYGRVYVMVKVNTGDCA